MQPKGTLYIIAAASGTGKSSLAEMFSQTVENIKISISHTTRPVRNNEKAGKHYFFTTLKEFESLIAQNEFLEYAKVFDHYYGTSRHFVEEQLNSGIDIILDIDWQGAKQVRSQIECTSIFLIPPSMTELRARLEKRRREGPDIIEQRLVKAGSEISHYKEFDYVIINDKFEDALADLQAIVRSRRLLLRYQAIRQEKLLTKLLGQAD